MLSFRSYEAWTWSELSTEIKVKHVHVTKFHWNHQPQLSSMTATSKSSASTGKPEHFRHFQMHGGEASPSRFLLESRVRPTYLHPCIFLEATNHSTFTRCLSSSVLRIYYQAPNVFLKHPIWAEIFVPWNLALHPLIPLAFRSIALQQVQETSPNIQISTTEGIRYRNLTPCYRSWGRSCVAFLGGEACNRGSAFTNDVIFSSVFRALFVHNWMMQHQLIYPWPIHLLISILLQLPVLKSSTPLAGHLRFAAFLKQEGIEIQLENLWISNREQLWRTFPKMLLAGIHWPIFW